MKVLYSWLREFIDVTASPGEIAALMSLRGFAVEGIERLADGDSVIDFEVTGNRPDCMSVAGMAREIATAYNLALKSPEPTTNHHPPPTDIEIQIDNPELCPRYVGAVADVTIGPSPAWMQARLTAGGIRPISNIVDITNYVLLELGQPMHAFDHALIGGGQIRIRTARPGEILQTLDDEERTLTPEMLVIADAAEPIALAGVKGGAKSEITGATRVIVFESAHFNAPSVRRTSRAFSLKTDASTRFERGSDPSLPALAMQRAIDAIKRCDAFARHGAADPNFAPRELLEIERVHRLAELEQHVVGDVDDVVDRTHACGVQPRCEPCRRGSDGHVGDRRGIPRAEVGCFQIDGDSAGWLRWQRLRYERLYRKPVCGADLAREPDPVAQIGRAHV